MNSPRGDGDSVPVPLPHLGLLRFAGPDAATFLQGQISNDTRRLSAGNALLAAYSSPQGRVLAVLQLVAHSSGIVAMLPREMVQPTLEQLLKYVLRAKVTIEDLHDQFAVYGYYGTPTPAAGGTAGPTLPMPDATQHYAESGGIGVARVATDPERCWIFGRLEDLSAQGLGAAARATPLHDELDWRLADIRAGMPQVYMATRELFVAQMLNLDLIDGISFTKGCFTGQEIIARTQHLGRIKRRMFRLRLPAHGWTVGQTVRLADGRSGRLTDVAATGSDCEALAVLTTEAELATTPAATATDDQPASPAVAAEELPLPYSLADVRRSPT